MIYKIGQPNGLPFVLCIMIIVNTVCVCYNEERQEQSYISTGQLIKKEERYGTFFKAFRQ